jgi:hypothetical protein
MPRSPLREQRRLHIPEMGYFSCLLCEKAAEAPAAFVFIRTLFCALFYAPAGRVYA